jgi:hypothetical protein
MAGFIGKGRILMGNFDADPSKRKFYPVGNAEELKISVSTEEKTLKNYLDCSGGDLETMTRVDKVTVSMSLTDFTPMNLEAATYGITSTTAAGTVTDEVVSCFQGYFTPTEHMINLTVAPVVKKGAITLVDGTDYRVTHGGIEILKGSEDVPAAWTDLTISYTKIGGTVLEALISSGKEISLVFEGFNTAAANGCAKGVAKLYRLKLSPLKDLSFIGDDFTKLQLEGNLLPDAAVTTAGLSKFFNWTMEA